MLSRRLGIAVSALLLLVPVALMPTELSSQAPDRRISPAEAKPTVGIQSAGTMSSLPSLDQVRNRLEVVIARVGRQTALSTDSLAHELRKLRLAVRALDIATPSSDGGGGSGPNPTIDVQFLEAQLRLRDGENARLQEAVGSLLIEIDALREVHASDAVATAEADALAAAAEAAARELELWTVGELYGHVRAWADLGLTLRAISLTAQNLLLFPEQQSSGFDRAWRVAGVLGTVAGAWIAQRDPGVGATTSGVSLAVAQVPSWFQGDKTSRLMENVARNRAFTDEVLAFQRIAGPFAETAMALHRALPPPETARSSGLPQPALAQYFRLISQRRDLGVVLRQMRAKAEYLSSLDGLTDEGKTSLERLLESYDQALAQWETTEESYTATYRYLVDRAARQPASSTRVSG